MPSFLPLLFALQTPAIAFVNGQWFNGTAFVRRTAYAAGGVFTTRQPGHVDTTLDLAGGFVVPPFAEAHNHNVEGANPGLDDLLVRYIRDGVFYVKNPNNLPGARASLAGRVNVPTGVDVIFSTGGPTGSGGHPAEIVRRNTARGLWTGSDGEGAFYWAVDGRPDLDRKWPAIIAGKPDFIKTYLLYSEDYVRRRDDTTYFGWRGLDPALLPRIVRRAHRAGLRVSTHVETAADFHNALAAGVDELNHTPGFRGDEHTQLPDSHPYEIADADARWAARHGTVVVTTLGGIATIDARGQDSLLRKSLDSLAARNLRLLKRHGVRLAVGSDSYRDTSVREGLYLSGLGMFTNLELLRMWSVETGRAIFPGRRIGCLESGCEASLLVLAGDPLADFSNVTHITLRVKQGRLLIP